jgi:hypothetical protein
MEENLFQVKEPTLASKIGHERHELVDKILRLKEFVCHSATYKTLSYAHKQMLADQLRAMDSYENALVARLVLLNDEQ